MQARFLFWAAIAGGSGVALGAFGAHGLKSTLSAYELEIYKTAVDYQMWHALLLGLIGSLPLQRQLLWAGWSLLAGIILFSGSLYLLAILKIRWLGMITPFGGTAFLAAWGLLAYAAYRGSKE